MRSSVPGMSPAKIAMAERVTIAPTAGTGSMKNVTGTSSAIAIVAVRPGMAPNTSPNKAAMRIVTSTAGWKTRPKAVPIALMAASRSWPQEAEGQGHAQKPHEGLLDQQRREDRHGGRDPPADAHRHGEHQQDQDRHRDETDGLRG